MSKVRSIRLNRKGENMLEVIKRAYSQVGTKSDTQVFVEGLEIQYQEIAEQENRHFKLTMSDELKKIPEQYQENRVYAENLLYRLADILEVLSVSEGHLLQDEFAYFLAVARDMSTFIEKDAEGDIISNNTKQYQVAWDRVQRTMHLERFDALDIMDTAPEATQKEHEQMLQAASDKLDLQIEQDLEMIYEAFKSLYPYCWTEE